MTFSNNAFREAWRTRETIDLFSVEVSKAQSAGELPTELKPKVAGVVPSPDAHRPIAKGTRFILTSAQNNTKIHRGFWQALHRFADAKKARLMVARFSYNKAGWGGQQVTKDSVENVQGETLWYAEEILRYVQNDSIKIADGLVFCAELDILPTAKDPLSGLDNYTGQHSMVVPHAKVHMRSYAGLRSSQQARFGYTTGTCTLRNYIERRAGQIASYHHVYGALYVEVAADGTWFTRQIIADDNGGFYDLGAYYAPNVPTMAANKRKLESSTSGSTVVNLGDIHAEKSDPIVFAGAMQFLRETNPDYVVVHDLLDFEARNHHNLKDPFFLADQAFNGMNTVEANFKHAVTLLDEITRNAPNAKILLVRSNHDEAFHRWLREYSPASDPVNAAFYHYHMWLKYEEIAKGNPEYDPYETALIEAAHDLDVDTSRWVHIKEDDSFVVNEIELGLHGHLGPNGSRGSPKSYRQLGRKLNTGHTHSAGIIDGVWTAGVLASLSMGYNKGPSSWSHSHILTHPNGKRQMITQVGDKWRA
jgi:hypothetical protein